MFGLKAGTGKPAPTNSNVLSTDKLLDQGSVLNLSMTVNFIRMYIHICI